MRILVADDSPTIQKVIKIALARYSVEIVSARSYADAMTEAAKGGLVACLVDAGLPGAKTPDDFLALQRQASDAPVVLLVGTYESFDEKVYAAANLREIIRKPFESGNITRTLSRVVGKGFDSALLSSFAGQPGALGSAPVMGSTVPPGRSQPPPLKGTDDLAFARDPVAFKDSKSAPPEFTGSHQIPPPPLLDEKRRGQKAFSEDEAGPSRDLSGDTEVTQLKQFEYPKVPPPPVGRVAMPPPAELKRDRPGKGAEDFPLVSGMNKESLETLIHGAVLEYCQKHFATMAREVLTAEIRRLAEERSKHLVDQ